METKQVNINGTDITLLKYNKIWVFPLVTEYTGGLGSPVAILLYKYRKGGFDYYCDVTVNLPHCQRNAGCQFIDTNNNDEKILDWLVQNQFGELTGNTGKSGFCTYPEFNFYKGQKFWEYKKISEKMNF
jgi:hypothetical protein